MQSTNLSEFNSQLIWLFLRKHANNLRRLERLADRCLYSLWSKKMKKFYFTNSNNLPTAKRLQNSRESDLRT